MRGPSPAAANVQLTGTPGQRLLAALVLLVVTLPFGGLGLLILAFNPDPIERLVGLLPLSVGGIGLLGAWYGITSRRLVIDEGGVRWYVGGRLRRRIPWPEVALVRLEWRYVFGTMPAMSLYWLSVYTSSEMGRLQKRLAINFRSPRDSRLRRAMAALAYYQRALGFPIVVPYDL